MGVLLFGALSPALHMPIIIMGEAKEKIIILSACEAQSSVGPLHKIHTALPGGAWADEGAASYVINEATKVEGVLSCWLCALRWGSPVDRGRRHIR